MSSILLKKIDILEKVGFEKQLEFSINKLIDFQLAKYQKLIQDINVDLQVFENKYKMQSQAFYEKFNTGELGDDSDYIEWAALYESIVYYSDKLTLLKSAA